jgi:hypothetical protein
MTKLCPGIKWSWVVGGAAVLAAALMASAPGARAAAAPTIGTSDAPTVGNVSSDAATKIDLGSAPAQPTVPMPAGLAINRPTMPAADYQAAQQRAAAPGTPADKTAPEAPATALSLVAQIPSTNETQFGGFPPDGDIATSSNWTVQIVNYALQMYCLTSCSQSSKLINFASFFGDSRFLFDPRIIFDPVWQRWVVLVDGCSPCSGTGTASFFALAISQTSDPTGGYFVYKFAVGTATGDFVDFPQMGMDLNSIIFTYNDFAATFFDARTFAIAKAYLYNGLGFGVNVFGGSGCTVAPPYVLDNGSPSYTLVACPNDNGVYLGPIFNSGLSNMSVQHWQAKVPVPAYTVPPCAPQPGVSYCLDTSDNRFENRSAQIGNRIWNVHEISDGTATPEWYEFNTGNSTLVSTDIWFRTGTSTDWHPSIIVNGVGATASNPTGEAFGTWMSVDAANNQNLSLRAIGGNGNLDRAGHGAGIAIGPASATALTDQTFMGNRSGDYSYISLYPAPAGGCSANEWALLEGEVAFDLTNWGTRVAIVKHC